ncbi:unnamed protein product [Didymodactylos carnosus]|uniref:Uncharacterized protein n=1 Tax=Didymodactylos carnosus TaxID=1234261 RepID=A0A815G2W4_9BILA|nr:unnamed protein product [Didymodactylos carnosus]CAF1333531.1 unnamed protein product [Didymodactylos carnosus]CAF3620314.1 unnamed protein product [Didymodactylos carnosus]CAF4189259.1 unnamed protein product [Didymodactylos carnosus]
MNSFKHFQISPSTLTERDEILLFVCFNSIMHSKYYSDEYQNKFCDKWLPKYESILHELAITMSLQLHTLKYLIVNSWLMQRSMDNILSFLMRGTTGNILFRNEYLKIINDLFVILNNEQFIEQTKMNNDTKSHDLEYLNSLENTITAAPTLVMCLIMKYILLLMNENDEIFSNVKQNQQAKEILLKLTNNAKNDDILAHA